MSKLNICTTHGKNNNDELYTPSLMVNPIIKYIPSGARVWCPFDTINSEFVQLLNTAGIDVTFSHIQTGQDFFKYQPSNYDLIISNPPFSKKLPILDRLYKLNKPFAVLFGLPILNYQAIGNFFHKQNSDLQLLIFDKKVSFDGNTSSFNCSYFCRDFLPKQLMFHHLEHNNTGDNYTPSRMHGDILK